MRINMKPTSVIIARLGLEPNGKVQRYFTKRCADYMDDYVPLDSGGLAYTNRIIEADKIIYNSPYAHYMYEGKVYGPNIPIKRNGVIVGWFSPKGKTKTNTGRDIDYSKSRARGHTQAGPHWDKRMWSVEKDNILKEVQDYIARGGK